MDHLNKLYSQKGFLTLKLCERFNSENQRNQVGTKKNNPYGTEIHRVEWQGRKPYLTF